ncbi:uncharacterized protein LOC124155272 [Ischnura elegans]|uniref:uncharacterized protein LOC124155272 n=1 Tax=Ischnura elegans TaxID=197161 RepID=UPI001ED8695C|nr:uncharacterized protein LOC124155272 [Ischnura elegans]
MGRSKCDVRGCLSHVKEVPIHMFPRTRERALVWLQFCGNPTLAEIPVEKLCMKASVCRKHFAPGQFKTAACLRLNLNAVPSLLPPPLTPLHLPSTSHLQSPLSPTPVANDTFESSVFSSPVPKSSLDSAETSLLPNPGTSTPRHPVTDFSALSDSLIVSDSPEILPQQTSFLLNFSALSSSPTFTDGGQS